MKEEIKQKEKCFFKDHLNNDAICYCPRCDIYMCNKCENNHSTFFQEHKTYKIENDMNDIFTGFCKNKKHPNKLEYFCKTHNELCCAACIAKINKIGDGQHKDCDACIINEIKDTKKNILANNIKKLEELSDTF